MKHCVSVGGSLTDITHSPAAAGAARRGLHSTLTAIKPPPEHPPRAWPCGGTVAGEGERKRRGQSSRLETEKKCENRRRVRGLVCAGARVLELSDVIDIVVCVLMEIVVVLACSGVRVLSSGSYAFLLGCNERVGESYEN